MNARTRLALARVQVADVVPLVIRKLNAAGYHAAAELVLDTAMDVALELARKRSEQEEPQP